MCQSLTSENVETNLKTKLRPRTPSQNWPPNVGPSKNTLLHRITIRRRRSSATSALISSFPPCLWNWPFLWTSTLENNPHNQLLKTCRKYFELIFNTENCFRKPDVGNAEHANDQTHNREHQTSALEPFHPYLHGRTSQTIETYNSHLWTTSQCWKIDGMLKNASITTEWPNTPSTLTFCPRSCISKSIILEIRDGWIAHLQKENVHHACLTATPVRKWSSNVTGVFPPLCKKKIEQRRGQLLQHIPACQLNATSTLPHLIHTSSRPWCARCFINGTWLEECIPHSHRQHHRMHTAAGTDPILVTLFNALLGVPRACNAH